MRRPSVRRPRPGTNRTWRRRVADPAGRGGASLVTDRTVGGHAFDRAVQAVVVDRGERLVRSLAGEHCEVFGVDRAGIEPIRDGDRVGQCDGVHEDVADSDDGGRNDRCRERGGRVGDFGRRQVWRDTAPADPDAAGRSMSVVARTCPPAGSPISRIGHGCCSPLKTASQFDEASTYTAAVSPEARTPGGLGSPKNVHSVASGAVASPVRDRPQIVGSPSSTQDPVPRFGEQDLVLVVARHARGQPGGRSEVGSPACGTERGGERRRGWWTVTTG